jgi:hypothetical protein
MQVPTPFPSFAMAALAGIGGLPDTIEDRSIIVHMRRRKSTETVKPFRLRRDQPKIKETGERLGTWLNAETVRKRLENAEAPESTLEDRAADVWESLLMVADLAGGDWPKRARAAAKTMLDSSADDEYEMSLPVRLLHDLRDEFAVIKSEWTPTEALLSRLWNRRDSPWSDMELTPHRLGRMLREFGIRSIRDPAGKKRGYRRVDFADAWDRYPPIEPSEASGSVNTLDDQRKQTDAWPDALRAQFKASEQVSDPFRSSGHLSDSSDGSDAYPAENGCRDCHKPMPDWVLSERGGRCITCDQDHRLKGVGA